MRKIKLAAIQPGAVKTPPELNCLNDAFCSDVEKIMKGHVLPHLNLTCEMIENCGREGCDLCLTSEDACQISAYLVADSALFAALAEASACIAEERFAALAKKYGMHVAACYFKRIDGRNYNVTSIFARDGAIVFEYRKTHLPPNEMWQTEAGNEINVAALDFGKVGIAICYDMMFPEMTGVLRERGAELVLHPTGGYGWYDSIGEATLRTRANDNSVYILTAKNYCFNGAGHSSLIDPWGQIMADAGFYENVIVSCTIDLDKEKTQPDWYYPTQMSGMAQVNKRARLERRPELYAPLCAPNEKMPVPDEKRRAELVEKIKTGECRW
jgi:Predicted amidohydrolase